MLRRRREAAHGGKERRPVGCARQRVECTGRLAFPHGVPLQRQHRFVQHRTVTGLTDVERQRVLQPPHTNTVVGYVQWSPGVVAEIFLARRIETFNVKILNIRPRVGEPPSDALVVADDDERNAGDRDTGNIEPWRCRISICGHPHVNFPPR